MIGRPETVLRAEARHGTVALTIVDALALIDAELAVRAVLQPMGGIVILPPLDPKPVAPAEVDDETFDAVAEPETKGERLRRVMALYDGKLLPK